MDGETAKLVLSSAQDTSNTGKTGSSSIAAGSPLQVRSLKAGDNDSLIQVIMYSI